MELFLEAANTLIYFLCVLNIGELFLDYKQRNTNHKKVVLFAITFITTIVMLSPSIWLKVIVHMTSVIIVVKTWFDEKFKNILGLYFGTFAVLSMLSTLLEMFSMEMINFLEISELISPLKIINWLLILGAIKCVGKYFAKKNKYGLKSIGTQYWFLFVFTLFFDVMVLLLLGDFILNSLQAEHKYIPIFFYGCVVIGLFIQLVLLINTLVTRNVHKENEKLAKQFLESQNEHYQYLEKREYETKKFRHDIKNHLLLVENLIATEKYDEAECYLNTINEKVLSFSNQISVNNGIADAILNRFYAEAKEDGVALKVKGHFPMGCYISAYDICTILSNLLSNAIRAAKETGDNEVLMNIKYTENQVMFTIENDYDELDEADGVFKSTKRDSLGHGFGLSNVNECVEKNGGFMSISTQNRRFKVMIMLLNEDEGTNENCNRR